MNTPQSTKLTMSIVVIVIIVFALIAFTIFFENDKTIEGYDGKISNITLAQCGTECTIGENCHGFAYKPVISTCYLSKRPILGEPVESAYNNEYSKLDKRCNKINPINDIDAIDDRTLTQNSVYVCSDGEANDSSEFQYANLGASSLETGDYVGGVAGRGVPTKIGDRPDTAAPLAVNYDVYEIEYPDPELGPLRDLEPNFPKLVRLNDAQLRARQGLSTDAERETILISDKLRDDSGRSAFIESDMEFIGQYLLGHQCVVNVPLYDCVKFCDNQAKCSGVEWNKSIVRPGTDDKGNPDGTNLVYENVCCPKQVIKKIIPRRNQFSRGKFYVKTSLDKVKGRDSLVLTRQNLQNPYGITDLQSTIQNNPLFDLQMTDRRSPDIYHHSEQDLSNVSPITNFVLPSDVEKINYA